MVAGKPDYKRLLDPAFWDEVWREAQAETDSCRESRGNGRDYWDSLASAYGKRRSLPEGDRLRQVTELLSVKGALHDRAAVLDIGSGPGVYTLLFAPLVREITAVDSAPKMCAVLNELAESRGLRNIVTANMDWHAVKLTEQGWEKRFDLVFASLTPAVRNTETLAKMIAASRGFCCLVEFARGYRNPVVAEIWEAVVGTPFPGGGFEAGYAWNYLYASGYLPDIHFIPDFWEEELPLKDGVERYSRSLGRFIKVTPEIKRKVRLYLDARSVEGTVRFTRRGYLAVLFWRTDIDVHK
jgi:SAM-dependent methyltransferase